MAEPTPSSTFPASSLPPFPPPSSSTTPPPPPPPPPPPGPPASGRRNGSSAGALWVAGLGAFLLVAAAATFVAVRWDDIPDAAKLAALVAVTLVCLQVHLRLRSSLPLTATVMLHLGVLLVPIDMAALGVRAGWSWPTMLLAQGVTATLVFGVAAWAERSVVLRAATWVGVVMLAGGIGGVTDGAAPAGTVLAAFALASVLGAGLLPGATRAGPGAGTATPSRWPTPELPAAGWAVLAGLAMPLAGAEELGLPEVQVLRQLGLTGQIAPWASLLTGGLAGVALGLVGHRRSSVPAALAGIGCVLAGATTAWLTLHPDTTRPEELDLSQALLAVTAVALLAELAAWAWRTDPFWFRPTELLAGLGEVVGGAVTVGAGAVVLDAVAEVRYGPVVALALAMQTLTWITGLGRRAAIPAAGRWPAAPPRLVLVFGPLAAAVTATAAVTTATGSAVATGWALTVLGGAVVLAWPRVAVEARVSGALAVGLLMWAPALVAEAEGGSDRVALVGGLALAGAVVVAAGVVGTTWSLPPRHATEPALLLAPLALLPLIGGSLPLAAAHGEGAAAAALGVAGVWLVATVLDFATLDRPQLDLAVAGRGPGGVVTPPDMSLAIRCAVVVPLAATLALAPTEAAGIAGAVAALAVIDAVRRAEPWLLLGAGAAVPVVAGALALDRDLSLAQAGLLVTLTGVAWLGLAGSLPEPWRRPALWSALLAGAVGFYMCAGDPPTLASYLLVVGSSVAAAGVALVQRPMVAGGAALATIGFWSHLSLAQVDVSEPYVAPAAVMAVAAGIVVRQREHVSSWIAYAPPVALLGGAALVERLAGGSAWHAIVAGAVGIAAVAAGGAGRLAGPLLVGTSLVVATTVHETLGSTAQLPTWVWLATGGLLLLGTGIAMERRDTGPVETGRRVVDLVRENFT